MTVLRFCLVISRDEQRNRLQARLDDPHKRWKFSEADLKERCHWDCYPEFYAEAMSATSTRDAPWYVIPANHKWFRNYLVAKIVAVTLEEMNPQYPPAPQGIDFRKVRIPA
jgi:polyphosphate kinase 2 (PPK2 family)